MVATGADREKLLKQAKGLSFLRTNEVPRDDAFNAFNDDQLRKQIKEYRTAINQNWTLDVPPEARNPDAPVSFGVQQPAAPVGTKDSLIALMDIELREGSALPSNDAMAVKSVMSVAGYDVDLNNSTFSAEEEAALARFQNNIDLFSLEEMANRNFAAGAAEEAARVRLEQEQATLELSQTQLKGSVASMLVYGGYLAPEDAQNDMRIASALNLAITINSPYENQVEDQKKMFVDMQNWQLTSEAAIYLRTNLGDTTPQNATRTGDLLREQLESGNPALISLAQGYLASQPGNEDLVINGTLDRATYDAGLAELQSPVALPAGVYDEDGTTIRGDKLMEYAVRGQLYLPVEALSPEDRALYDSLPFAADREPGEVNAKERLLASRLILNNPEGYARLLEAENARRAAATLDVQVQLPVVEVPATATIVEEQLDIAQNPAGLLDNEEGNAVYDASQPIVDSIKEDGIGVTDRSGFVVFENQPIALSGIVEAIKLDKGAFGDGNADNLIGMDGAINLVRGAVSANDIGLTGASIPLVPDNVWAINQSLGYDANYRFDITDPYEMQALLNGVITYQNVSAAGVPFTEDFIAQYSTTDRDDVKNAVGIASGVIPTEPAAPAPTEETPNEGAPALGPAFLSSVMNTGTKTPPPVLVADNIDRRPAQSNPALSGPS